MKLAKLPMEEEVRNNIVKDILHYKHPTINLYAWKVSTGGIAEEAFFSSHAAVKDWYVSQKLWEKDELPKGIVVHTWKTHVEEILHHISDNSVRNITLTENRKIEVAISPSELHEDVQRTLENQS
jgi:hypothetical protein